MKAYRNSTQDGYWRVVVRTSDGSTFEGNISIGTERRLSDIFLDLSKPFIILLDAKSKGNCCETMLINKTHILWAIPK